MGQQPGEGFDTERSSYSVGEAARLLEVSPSTLRSWERRYGFPRPIRTSGGHRRYPPEMVGVLAQALRAKSLGVRYPSGVIERLVEDLDRIAHIEPGHDPDRSTQ